MTTTLYLSMKEKLQVTRPEIRRFFNLYLGGRKTYNAPEGYINYYEARSYLLQELEALEKKHAEQIERIQMEHAREIEILAQDDAGESL